MGPLPFFFNFLGKFITRLGNSALNWTQNLYRMNHDIGFQVQFKAEFTIQVMNFP